MEFLITKANSLPEALTQLSDHAGKAKIVAGATDFILEMEAGASS